MVKISALVHLALASVALAVTFTDCQNQFDACRSSSGSSKAGCVADHATCCADAFDTCNTSDDPGTVANCAVQEAHCQSQK
ncbi:hypothetical protein ASPWEDRAFT_41473 [Aspergillus terreus]|uniref:Uncharacterized protein n=1 Tax=Aspergillus terreus TaxID=33178 RepID=A0A5M3YPZ0_ASPTE|nr:hypothetical protein ATETN484_0001037000 [Aspergillus terreus]GFF12226.1 hypothetical protein ASPWEDRAFT_41473 [Aspergillus terreus]